MVCPGFSHPEHEIPSTLNLVDTSFLVHSVSLNCFCASGVSFNQKEQQLFHQKSPGTNEALHFGALVGESETFVRAIKNIPPLAQSDATVLICGETGTGKELFARAIHYHSPRQNKPFIPVNCAALPDHLFENELFGHAKGAYTDASVGRKRG